MTMLIRAYQLVLSPILAGLGCQCRYYPTCSEVARRNFATLPFTRALWVSVRRVLSCY